ncbi:MAG TPA: HK97 gp10 family phage protein [Mycobacteriales bacterium]|nr:HK97 gp10 family phage protein [Mycobacteriales bacterium]
MAIEAVLPGVRVEGLAQLSRQLRAAGVGLDDLKDVMAAIAAEGARVAAELAPERTGRLRATIRGNRAARKATVAAGRASVKYAGPVNYGWPERHIEASEFMQRTDDVMEPRATEMLDQGVRDLIARLELG